MHVTVKPSSPRPLVTCDCSIYSFNAVEAHRSDQFGMNDISCLHCRFVHEVVQACAFPELKLESNLLPHYIDYELVGAHIGEAQTEIIELKGKPGTRKFSVLSPDTVCEIVSEYKKPSSNRTIVTCHNSFCKINNSSGRVLENISNSKACVHLKTYAMYVDSGAVAEDCAEVNGDNMGEEGDEQPENSSVCFKP